MGDVVVTVVITGLAAHGAANQVYAKYVDEWGTVAEIMSSIRRRTGVPRWSFYLQARAGDDAPYVYAPRRAWLWDFSY